MSDWKQLAIEVAKDLGEFWSVTSTDDGLDIRATPSRVMGESELTFALLEKISARCETKNINCVYNGGWSGTEVTPGSSGSLTITVRG